MSDFTGKRLPGVWWRAGKAKQKFRGVLVLDEDNHGTLTLRGRARHLEKFPLRDITLLGRFSAQYAYQVSLLDVGVSRPASGGLGNEVIEIELFAQTVVIAAHIRSSTSRVITGARCRLSGLREWSDESGFVGKIERVPVGAVGSVTRVTHQEAATSYYAIGRYRQLRLVRRYSGPVIFPLLKQIQIEEVDEIELRFRGRVSLRQLMGEILVWQTFLAFAVRQASIILGLRIRLRDDGANSFSREVLIPIRKPQPASLLSARRSALFLRSTWGDDVLRRWASAYRKLANAVNLFAGTTYQENAFVHTTLLFYLQALEVYHREAFPDAQLFRDQASRKQTLIALRKALPGSLPDDVRKRVKERLGWVGELSFLERLYRLRDEHEMSVGPLFPNANDMQLLRDVRNFLTHYGNKKTVQEDFATSRRAFVLREKTRFFVEACFLSAIAIDDADIYEQFDQSPAYTYWCREKH
jgi:hypothetical protein